VRVRQKIVDYGLTLNGGEAFGFSAVITPHRKQIIEIRRITEYFQEIQK